MKLNDTLQTPEYLWKALAPFDLDPCAGEHTNIAKDNWWIERGEDGLERKWNGFVWCNPPFSQKELWIEKMKIHKNGIMILPERGSAPWFGPLAEYVGLHFVMGKKVNFIGGPSSNNVGSVLFPFGKLAIKRIEESGLPGHFNEVMFFISREYSELITKRRNLFCEEFNNALNNF